MHLHSWQPLSVLQLVKIHIQNSTCHVVTSISHVTSISYNTWSCTNKIISINHLHTIALWRDHRLVIFLSVWLSDMIWKFKNSLVTTATVPCLPGGIRSWRLLHIIVTIYCVHFPAVWWFPALAMHKFLVSGKISTCAIQWHFKLFFVNLIFIRKKFFPQKFSLHKSRYIFGLVNLLLDLE